MGTVRPALALAALLAPATAAAAEIEPARPETIRAVAARFGSAVLDRDGFGDPLIVAAAGRINYIVEFYGCRNGRNCTEILLRASFVTDRATARDMAAWNRAGHRGKAYLDENGAPHLEMDVVLAGGTSEANMIDTFALWGQTLDEFVRYLGWDG